jgi:AsmA protein
VFANGRLSLLELSGTMGEGSLAGSVTVDTGGARPHLAGSLKLSELDLRALFVRPAGTRVSRADSAAAKTGADAGAAKPSAASSEPPVDSVRSSGWSDDRIDLGLLALADADLTLAVDRLRYKDVVTGPGRLSLALKDKVAKLTLDGLQLYGGHGRGLLTLDGAHPAPAVETDLVLEGVSVLPLLKHALDFDWLEGRSTLVLTLSGQGASERQIIETLNGRVYVTTSNGAILGWDIAKILAGLEQGRLAGFEGGPGDKTEFSEFAGTLAIANGVGLNEDLRLVNPHLRLAGAGKVDLKARQLDYTVRPTVTSSAAGQAALVNLAGIEVPIRISGAWEKPTFAPELKGFLKKNEKAAETIKQIGKNLKSQDVKDAIKDLLSGDGEKKVKPRELLEKLLKKE